MQVIYGGPEVFNNIAYREQHPANAAYFRNQIENVSESLNDIGRAFFANTQALYEQFNSSEALRLARLAIQAAKSLFEPERIMEIHELIKMQNATLSMQRWIMANPVMRELHHQQKCDGFSDTYKDMEPGKIGSNHYDYRRVMDGMIQENDEDGWTVSFFPDEIEDGDRELSMGEKHDILNTWEILEMFIKQGEDPTSPFGAKL